MLFDNALHIATQAGNLAEVQAQVSNFDINEEGDNYKTALYYAAQEGKTEVVKLLLTLNPDVNKTDTAGNSALIVAAAEGHREIVQELMKVDGINVNHANSYGKSALIYAAEKGHREIIQALLTVDGINVNHANKDGDSAWIMAAGKGHNEVIQELLTVDGINVNHANNYGYTAFLSALEKGHTEIIQALLKVDGMDVNHANKYGDSALIMASGKGKTEIVNYLLKADGINVNRVDNDYSTALIKAAANGHTVIVKELLKAPGINVNHANKYGHSALTWAAEKSHIEIIQALLKADGIDVNHAEKFGKSALTIAAGNDQIKIVQELLTVDGINVNHANQDGDSALTWAARRGHTEIIQALLKAHDINVNHANKDGCSALTNAAHVGHIEMVQALLQIDGININHTTIHGGHSALTKAAAAGFTEIVKELLQVDGINVNYANNNGQSALTIAAYNDHIETIQELLTVDGINVNHANKDGDSALIQAAGEGHTEIIQELLKVDGINVNYANNVGNSALIMAAAAGFTEIVQALLKAHDINANHANNNEDTSMHHAAKSGNVDAFVTLLSHGANVRIKNKEYKTCFDVMKSAKDKLTILIKTKLNLSILEAHNCALWFVIVQEDGTSDTNLFSTLLIMVETLVFSHPILSAAKDADGRAAVDVASKPMKLIMQSVLLWHGRYRITEHRPEHISATCFVYKAIDEHTIDMETSQPIKVALKLMRLKDQFQREISTRDKEFNHQMVMNVLQQIKPNLLRKTSQVDKEGVYYSSQLGVYSKSYYRCVEKALVEMVYRIRSDDATKLVPRHRCSKHKHDLSLNPTSETVVLEWGKCNVCSVEIYPDSPRYSCTPCEFAICETCFNKDDDHQEFPAESTTWLFTIQSGKDQPETELARSHEPTMHVSDAVFTNFKVSEGENGTVIVVDIQMAVRGSSEVIQDNEPDKVMDVETDSTGQLTKTNAEKLYLLVMPLADRNLFVALKQERWAGKNMEEVRHVFVQLVRCVEHMHEKGVLHADLKTLNIVRTAGQWKLIDLDAACVIGQEPVGHKSSSAYVPPEAIYIDDKTDTACVRSVVAVTKGEATYELLTAHPSFDVWSLGCIMYQMCTTDVKPLFQGGQDDNLVGVRKGVDNLFALAEWSSELKADKLTEVLDKLARNLLSQMLHKDPLQRPSLARVLAHSFLSGKKVARLIGEKPKYDIFLSYRVASDAQHVEKLYNLLTAQGFKVYWDKLCLEPGVDWEQGFCEGLVSSRAFVPLLSRDAINHPDKAWQNFSKLTADQPNCDNVFLENRLAVELQGLGLIEKIFPVFIGNLDTTTPEYSDYFKSGCHPSLPDIAINSVEEKLRHHMESQALGTPIVPDRTVKSVVGAITACQGAFIVGPAEETFAEAAASIAKMLTDVPVTQSPRPGTHVHQALADITDNKTLVAENSALKDEVGDLKSKNGDLKGENDVLKSKNGALTGKVDDALSSLRSGQFTSVEALAAHMEALLQG